MKSAEVLCVLAVLVVSPERFVLHDHLQHCFESLDHCRLFHPGLGLESLVYGRAAVDLRTNVGGRGIAVGVVTVGVVVGVTMHTCAAARTAYHAPTRLKPFTWQHHRGANGVHALRENKPLLQTLCGGSTSCFWVG